MRVLAITNIFPNRAQPLSAPFNRQQFVQLSKLCDLQMLATVPWFPGAKTFAPNSAAALTSDVPAVDVIDGITVHHPRTLHLPKMGRSLATPMFGASLLPYALKFKGSYDVILGSWAHPDGCAAIALAKLMGVPCAVKLHGSDMNVIAHMPGPRFVIKHLLPKADAVIAVSRPLAIEAEHCGVAKNRLHVVMNGVDSTVFKVQDRKAARAALGLPQEAPIALFVGNLKESKGVLDLLSAYQDIATSKTNPYLYIVGQGAEESACKALAEKLPNLHVVGSKPLSEIPMWLAACDGLVLPSWAEGTPNVLLEAQACGRRVVATSVGGIPDVIHDPKLGILCPPKSPRKLGAAILELLSSSYDPDEVARIGDQQSWPQSAKQLFDVLASIAP